MRHIWRWAHKACTHVHDMQKNLLKDTSKLQPPPLTGHHCSAPFDIPHIDMCAEVRTPPLQDSLMRSQWCPYYGGSTVQDSLSWSQWCPYYRGFTVQDSLLWSQWCPYYRGLTVQDSLLWSQWCPYYRGFTVYHTIQCP